MKNPRTMLLLSVIVAVLLMGVAYAAIQNIDLTVSADVVATADQGNFKVKLNKIDSYGRDKENNPVDYIFTSLSVYPEGLKAQLSANGFKKVGDSAKFYLKLTNESKDIWAAINTNHVAITKNGNTEYFDVKCYWDEYADGGLSADGYHTLFPTGSVGFYVEVTMNKVPINGNVTINFDVEFDAYPTYIAQS